MINDAEPAKRAAALAAEIVEKENDVTDLSESLGADDFADFLAAAPGVYARVAHAI